MIYEEDVHEALIFAPEVSDYNGCINNEMAIMVRSSRLIPYVRRVLNSVYGLPSRTSTYYHRYGDFVIHFVSDPNDRHPFNPQYWEDNGNNVSAFYVREKGERVGNKPHEVDALIFDSWMPLVFSAMPESDAWLHIADTTIFGHFNMLCWR